MWLGSSCFFLLMVSHSHWRLRSRERWRHTWEIQRVRTLELNPIESYCFSTYPFILLIPLTNALIQKWSDSLFTLEYPIQLGGWGNNCPLFQALSSPAKPSRTQFGKRVHVVWTGILLPPFKNRPPLWESLCRTYGSRRAQGRLSLWAVILNYWLA